MDLSVVFFVVTGVWFALSELFLALMCLHLVKDEQQRKAEGEPQQRGVRPFASLMRWLVALMLVGVPLISLTAGVLVIGAITAAKWLGDNSLVALALAGAVAISVVAAKAFTQKAHVLS